MMDKHLLDDLAGKLAAVVPEDLAGLREDLRGNFQTVLQSGLDKLDMVTREEFEVQRKVLERTREKLERMQRELEELRRDTIGEDDTNDAAE